MNTPTPTKAQEIDLLQRLTAQAREAGALYLHDALCALAVPFEHAVRSDFPGAVASQDAIDATRAARLQIANLNTEIQTAQKKLQELANQTSETSRSYYYAKQQLEDVRTSARRLINL